MLLGTPAASFAQDSRGASVSGVVSAALFDSQTQLSLSGAFAYRFSQVVGLELEATVVPRLRSAYPDGDRYVILASRPGLAIFPPPRFENVDGRMVIVSNNVRIAVPTTSARLEPYFVAGGGIASVRRTADYVWVYPYCPACLATADALPPDIARGLLVPMPSPITETIRSSSVDLALTLGGGVSVRVTSQLAVDADLRTYRLLGEQDRSVGRFGVGVRYRF